MNQPSPMDFPPKSRGWVNLAILSALAFAWAAWQINLMTSVFRGSMGFHPAVLFSVPFGGLLVVIGAVNATASRSIWQFLGSILLFVIVVAPIFFAFDITQYAWAKQTRLNADQNLKSIRATDFSAADFNCIPYKDHERMVPVIGFTWNTPEPSYEATDGQFLGFTVDKVPHVYVCPIRNGCRGVAWIEDKSFLDRETDVRYFSADAGNWYFWIM